MKKQIVAIGGGETFRSYEDYLADLQKASPTLESLTRKKWRHSLQDALPEFLVLTPEMPNGWNAHYREWKIWFEKILTLLEPESILVGHSLGAIFLVKFFSESAPPQKVHSLHLVSAPYDDESKESLGDFILTGDISVIQERIQNIFFYHSTDDPVTPFSELAKYQAALPNAKTLVFNDRNHFLQSEFPELIETIKKSL